MTETKYCPDCGADKPINEFNRDKYKASGLRSYCREHDRARVKDYYQRNRALRIAQMRARYWRQQAANARSTLAGVACPSVG